MPIDIQALQGFSKDQFARALAVFSPTAIDDIARASGLSVLKEGRLELLPAWAAARKAAYEQRATEMAKAAGRKADTADATAVPAEVVRSGISEARAHALAEVAYLDQLVRGTLEYVERLEMAQGPAATAAFREAVEAEVRAASTP